MSSRLSSTSSARSKEVGQRFAMAVIKRCDEGIAALGATHAVIVFDDGRVSPAKLISVQRENRCVLL